MLNLLTVTYLFLGGAGAGACLVLAVTRLLRCALPGGRPLSVRAGGLVAAGEARRFWGFGYAVAAAVQVLGMVCLLCEMGRPDKVLMVLTAPSLSVTTVGAVALGGLVVLSLGLAVAWLRMGPTARPRTRAGRVALAVCEVLAALTALVVMAYTALLLRSFAGARFWDTTLLVALFMLSGVSTGTALVVAVSSVVLRGGACDRVADALFAVDAVVIALEALAAAGLLLRGATVDPAACDALLRGDLALVFWMGFVCCGLVAPTALGWARRHVRGVRIHPWALCALVLVGGFCLRYGIALVPR